MTTPPAHSDRGEGGVERDPCGCHWDDPCLCVFEGPTNPVRTVRYSAEAVQSIRAMGLRRFPLAAALAPATAAPS